LKHSYFKRFYLLFSIRILLSNKRKRKRK